MTCMGSLAVELPCPCGPRGCRSVFVSWSMIYSIRTPYVTQTIWYRDSGLVRGRLHGTAVLQLSCRWPCRESCTSQREPKGCMWYLSRFEASIGLHHTWSNPKVNAIIAGTDLVIYYSHNYSVLPAISARLTHTTTHPARGVDGSCPIDTDRRRMTRDNPPINDVC
jgi:hypothetical protein